MSNQETNTNNSSQKYIVPKYRETAFHCPYCEVLSNQRWFDVGTYDFYYYKEYIHSEKEKIGVKYNYSIHDFISNLCQKYQENHIKDIQISFCDHCKKYSIWFDKKMVCPRLSSAPLPIDEMPENVKILYNEAREILNLSPRGACALLRLSVQHLLKELGEDKENLHQAIKNLVKKRSLPDRIEKALHSVRVIGNEAVHPGEINFEDNPEIANSLFDLINYICEKTVKEDKRVDQIFESLPKNKKKNIEQTNRESTQGI